MDKVQFWHWFILGILFVFIDLLMPGSFVLWLGFSAFISGFLIWLISFMVHEIDWTLQLIIYGILVLGIYFIWRKYGHKKPSPTDQPFLNERGSSYVGRVVPLFSSIINGRGKLKVDDVLWTCTGPDLPKGTLVFIKGIRSNVLEVQIYKEGEHE